MTALIAVPQAEFLMGSTAKELERCAAFWSRRLVDAAYTEEMFRFWLQKETPTHWVQLKPYRIGKYPVTNGEYAAYCGACGAREPQSLLEGSPEDHPVWGVSFEEAQAYARWLSEELGRPFRLPTEAEWEYAARGPLRRDYPFGDGFDAARANTLEAGVGQTTPVDRYARWASPLGVCDLAGNVEEWVDARYAPYPGGRFVSDDLVDRLGPDYRILRGGSFARGGDLARCARRHGPYPSPAFRYTGFRVAQDAAPGGIPR